MNVEKLKAAVRTIKEADETKLIVMYYSVPTEKMHAIQDALTVLYREVLGAARDV